MNKDQFVEECMKIIKEKYKALPEEEKEDALYDLSDAVTEYADEEIEDNPEDE